MTLRLQWAPQMPPLSKHSRKTNCPPSPKLFVQHVLLLDYFEYTEAAMRHTLALPRVTSFISEIIMTQRGRLQTMFLPMQQRLMAAFRISTHH